MSINISINIYKYFYFFLSFFINISASFGMHDNKTHVYDTLLNRMSLGWFGFFLIRNKKWDINTHLNSDLLISKLHLF
jgi:hypothetical protein